MGLWKRRLMWGLSGVIGGALLPAAAGRAGTQATPAETPPGLVWPNRESKANSDDWLRLHHSEIRQMKPRVLILNFVNGLSTEEATRKIEAVVAAVREASRYHGYQDPKAPPFLDYQIVKVADCTDEVLPPEDQRLDGNSSLYPRPPDWKPGMVNFRYSELFTDKFAEHVKIADPDTPTKTLTLDEMVNQGLVHEVWFLALQGNYGAPYETVEIKQAYDANLHKIPGKSVQAGVGPDDLPLAGRSLRIVYINPERGPGCTLEALGRSLEGMAKSRAVPYFSRYFAEFAGFDLKKRYGAPFDSLYERPGGMEVDYPSQTSLAYQYKGESLVLRNYIPAGGSVHFTPNSRRDFDLNNPEIVQSTIEHFRLHDGPDGKDRPEPWINSKFNRYQRVANGCVGPWMVYWRQSMPGYGNKATDDNGKPMKNWWPFLFY